MAFCSFSSTWDVYTHDEKTGKNLFLPFVLPDAFLVICLSRIRHFLGHVETCNEALMTGNHDKAITTL